jgi:hypothetical protein
VRRLLPAAVAAALLVVPSAVAAEGRVIFSDLLTGVPGQHATAVEPDTDAWGNTVVSAFQVGRVADGGAAAIGWATSVDGGSTWRTGLIPGLTPSTSPPGPFQRVSDPAVAYDRVHGVWLVSILVVDRLPGGDPDTALIVSRSADGVTWSLPVITSPKRRLFAHDKNWIACDDWPASPYAGRCYVTWSNPADGSAVALSTSTDGGLQWGPAATAAGASGTGTQPVVRPDGTLVIPYRASGMTIRALVSRDGGATLGAPIAVADVRVAPVPELRSPPLPSAEVAADGRVYVVWHDCRFRRDCGSNDIVLVSSADGVSWSVPARVPLSALRFAGAPDRGETHHVIPGLGVDASTGGGGARLALASYAVGRFCAVGELTCPIAPSFVSSADGGRTWSTPVALSDPQPLSAIADTTQGRMVGDYVSTSFVSRGVAVPVVSAPVAPAAGTFAQPILAASFAPRRAAPVRVASISYGLTPTHPGARLTARAELDRRPVRPVAVCSARVGKRALPVLRRGLVAERVECAWRVPRRSAGATVRATIGIRHAAGAVNRPFRVPVRRR